MRINSSEGLKKKHVNNLVRVNLSGGYHKGFWHQEAGAILLITGDSITTVIPDKDIRLNEDMKQCCSCEALIMDDCDLENCRWCGEEDYEEPVSSLAV